MAKESLALDRFQVLYFNGAVLAGQDLPAARGGAAGAYNVNRAAGNVRLFGVITGAQAPAAGFPRVNFWAKPGVVAGNTLVNTYTPPVDPNNANSYPLETPLLTPYFTVEWTQGATPGNVVGVAWVSPEPSPAAGGVGPLTPIFVKDGPLTDLGFGQVTNLDNNTPVTLATIFGAAIPAGTTTILVQVGTGTGADTSVTCNWRADGTPPSATVGQTLLVGVGLTLPLVAASLAAFQVVGSGAGPSTCRVTFFK